MKRTENGEYGNKNKTLFLLHSLKIYVTDPQIITL